MARGQVVCWKHNANGYIISRSNQNTILDTHLYEVEFPGEEMTDLVAKSLQSQCMPSVMSMEMNTYY